MAEASLVPSSPWLDTVQLPHLVLHCTPHNPPHKPRLLHQSTSHLKASMWPDMRRRDICDEKISPLMNTMLMTTLTSQCLATAPSPGLCNAEPGLNGTESWDVGPCCDARPGLAYCSILHIAERADRGGGTVQVLRLLLVIFNQGKC